MLCLAVIFASFVCVNTACKIDEIFLERGIYNTAELRTTRYLNCSVEQGQIALNITWKIQDHVLKQASGPIRWLELPLNMTTVRLVEDLRCEMMVGNKNYSCGFEQEAPRITSRRHSYEAYVGTPLVIPCRATGIPQPDITWIKRDQSLGTQGMPPSIKQIRSGGSVNLVIKKASLMHSGIYTCLAVNRLGKNTHFVVITVLPIDRSFYLLPRVVPMHRMVTVRKGSTAKLVCSAMNTPLPLTAPFWKHTNGTRVTNTARLNTQARYSESIIQQKYKDQSLDMSLTISDVTSKDAGRYTCGVVTHVGRHEGHVELKIKD